jgi:CRISPR-associated endonuclease Cas1
MSSSNLPVLVLTGYGIQVRIDRGHLLVEDGIGTHRRRFRFPRVGHGLRRLVVIGSDGMVSLAALRWLADQDAAFVMLERDGSVLATTGPVRPSDAKLRRSQALAVHSGADVRIARELISRKLAGQEQVARAKLGDPVTADSIARFRAVVPNATRLDEVRMLESQAAAAYWSAWRDLPITFPKNDLIRVPDHWRTFDTRKSPLSGSPRLAANPVNAMLNYLYALLEAESRLAAAALGLDPGLGVLHVDTPARDSLACDLMEAIRPRVDAYVLDWVLSQPLSRKWFFEQRDGNCRLMAEFAIRLTETVGMWARAVGPVAEWVAQELWSTTRKRVNKEFPPTRLTQNSKREAKGRQAQAEVFSAPPVEKLCRNCGKALSGDYLQCLTCARPALIEHMIGVAQKGRLTAHSSQAQASRSATQQRNWSRINQWKKSNNPTWLNEQTYKEKIQPGLTNITNSVIARTLGVSVQYAVWIRRGERQPHPRHWLALAQLVGSSLHAANRPSGHHPRSESPHHMWLGIPLGNKRS